MKKTQKAVKIYHTPHSGENRNLVHIRRLCKRFRLSPEWNNTVWKLAEWGCIGLTAVNASMHFIGEKERKAAKIHRTLHSGESRNLLHKPKIWTRFRLSPEWSSVVWKLTEWRCIGLTAADASMHFIGGKKQKAAKIHHTSHSGESRNLLHKPKIWTRFRLSPEWSSVVWKLTEWRCIGLAAVNASMHFIGEKERKAVKIHRTLHSGESRNLLHKPKIWTRFRLSPEWSSVVWKLTEWRCIGLTAVNASMHFIGGKERKAAKIHRTLHSGESRNLLHKPQIWTRFRLSPEWSSVVWKLFTDGMLISGAFIGIRLLTDLPKAL